MKYGDLKGTFSFQAKLGKAIEYYFFMTEDEMNRAAKKLIKEGYTVEPT
jgi:hypothetical protein